MGREVKTNMELHEDVISIRDDLSSFLDNHFLEIDPKLLQDLTDIYKKISDLQLDTMCKVLERKKD